MTRCQVCGRRLGLSKAGAIPHHNVKGKPCPGKGHPPIEQDDAALAAAVPEARAAADALWREYRGLIDRRANYIPPHLLPDYLAASAWAGRLERRLKRHREWPARFEREMARDGMGMPPPDYLLRRSQ